LIVRFYQLVCQPGDIESLAYIPYKKRLFFIVPSLVKTQPLLQSYLYYSSKEFYFV